MSAPRCSDDDGQVVPIMLVVVAVLMVAVFWFLETGRAGTLRIGGQSAGDAAALAAAAQMQTEAIGLIRNPPPGLSTLPPGVYGRTHDAARDYAARNGGRLQRYEANLLEFRAEVDTEDRLEGAAADRLGVAGTRGEARSRARLTVDWLLSPPPIRTRLLPLSQSEIDAIASRNGIDPQDEDNAAVLAASVLHSPHFCAPGPDVKNLNDRMHDVIVRLEADEDDGIGPISLVDGYQTPACGGWGSTLGIHSPLNYGDAFRTGTGYIGAVAARMGAVGLCRPFPSDPALFAHRDSHVCDGRTGDLGPGGAYGNLRNVVDFKVELIPDEGPLGASGP